MKIWVQIYLEIFLKKIKDGVPIDENQSTGLKLYGTQLDRIDSSGSYINSRYFFLTYWNTFYFADMYYTSFLSSKFKREVTKRFRVDPGNYLIIPSTYDEDRDCEFMLRVFTEAQIDAGYTFKFYIQHKKSILMINL